MSAWGTASLLIITFFCYQTNCDPQLNTVHQGRVIFQNKAPFAHLQLMRKPVILIPNKIPTLIHSAPTLHYQNLPKINTLPLASIPKPEGTLPNANGGGINTQFKKPFGDKAESNQFFSKGSQTLTNVHTQHHADASPAASSYDSEEIVEESLEEVPEQLHDSQGYDHYKTTQTSYDSPYNVETIDSDHYHKTVPAFDVSKFQHKSHHEAEESHGEVHYHQHKHYHKHDHKQEHKHEHKQAHQHKHEHKHGHEHHQNHKHGHEHKHMHHQEHKHDHHQQHKHDHKHDHGHKHEHHNKHKHEHKHGHKHQHKAEHKHKQDHHHGHKHVHHGHGHGR